MALWEQGDADRIAVSCIGARKECFAILARQMRRDRTAWGARWTKVLLSTPSRATCLQGTSACKVKIYSVLLELQAAQSACKHVPLHVEEQVSAGCSSMTI